MKRFFQPLVMISFAIVIIALGVCIAKLIEINKIQTALEQHEKVVTKEYWLELPAKGHFSGTVEFEMTYFESFNPLELLYEVRFELGKYSYLHTREELQDSTITAIINQLQNDDHIIKVKVIEISK